MKNGVFVGIGVVIAIIGLFSLYNDSSITNNEYTVSFSEQKITPKISSAIAKTYSIEPTTSQVLPENNESISTSANGYFLLPFYQAFAVTSVQNTISITQWQVTSGNIRAFDSQGNFFTHTSNKIGRGDISTDIHTQWTLPNNESFFTDSMDVDSSGNVFFSQRGLSNEDKITKFDHNTNTFTEWILPSPERAILIKIDSADNVFFFSDNADFLGRLEPSTNTITTWGSASTNNVQDMIIDPVDDVYLVSTGTREIIHFDPSSNTITVWPTLNVNNNIPRAVAVNSTGHIFFTETVPFNTIAIARLDPGAQMIKEWLIPELSLDFCACKIIVDSAGNVFFGTAFNRLVPSTNTVTTWNEPNVNNFFEVNSTNIIIWANNAQGGTVT